MLAEEGHSLQFTSFKYKSDYVTSLLKSLHGLITILRTKSTLLPMAHELRPFSAATSASLTLVH